MLVVFTDVCLSVFVGLHVSRASFQWLSTSVNQSQTSQSGGLPLGPYIKAEQGLLQHTHSGQSKLETPQEDQAEAEQQTQ